MSVPVESPRGILCGDRELYMFHVMLADIPGALLKAATVFYSYGLNIVSIYTTESSYGDRQEVEVNFVVDFTGKRVSPEQVAKSLNLETVVKQVVFYGKQLPNMIVDEKHFPLIVMGERAIIFRESTYKGLILGLRKQLGAAGEALLYHIGLNNGKGTWAALKNLIGGKVELLPQYLKYWMFLVGASVVKEVVINMEKKRAVVRVENSYECELGRGAGKPFSNFHRGVFAGIFSELLGSERSVETKCIAAGDPYCEFVIGNIEG
jgi:predicted hydrocarbon binding protein